MTLNYVEMQKSISEQTQVNDLFNEVQRLKEVTHGIPALVKSDPTALQKAWRTADSSPVSRAPKAAFFDPLSLQYAMGYKDRRYSLTYDTLKRIPSQVAVIAAIINTRIAQIAGFCQPYRQTKSLGFAIKHKDPEHETTKSERRFIRILESFICNCGEPGRPNPYFRYERDDFEGFVRKIVRDTMVYDQVAFEVVPRRNGIPFEFWAVDASTIRIASSQTDAGINWSYHIRNNVGPVMSNRFQGLYQGAYGVNSNVGTLPENQIQYVQVINGQIENIYTGSELAFGVRNPRTDIYIQGYGYGELEQMITIVTSLLYSEEYNKRYFTNGAHPKGLLNFKGDNWTPDQLEAFRRQWTAQAVGVENAWKTPITQSEGIEWVNLQMSNREMEFGQWIEYLIKLVCGVFLIDPAEINFDLHGGVQQTPLFESSQEWKLKASRDRGLRPLLRFIAKLINRHIIDKIDDHFVFEFVGLDELSEQEKHEMMKEQTSSYMTLNEGRRALDLPDLEFGDVPMSPVYIQVMQMRQQQAQQQQAQQQQMEQQQAQQQQMPGADQQPGAGEQDHQSDVGQAPQYAANSGQDQQPEAAQGQQQQSEEGQAPQYAANFGKSHSPNEIVIRFDDWIDQKRSK
jgi:hypothetical protein